MTIADELEDLLAREHGLILAGRLETLSRIEVQKSELIRSFSKSFLDQNQAIRIREAASRNGRLLESVSNGIKAAIRTIEDARSVGDQTTYGPSGQRQKIHRSGERLHQKI